MIDSGEVSPIFSKSKSKKLIAVRFVKSLDHIQSCQANKTITMDRLNIRGQVVMVRRHTLLSEDLKMKDGQYLMGWDFSASEIGAISPKKRKELDTPKYKPRERVERSYFISTEGNGPFCTWPAHQS